MTQKSFIILFLAALTTGFTSCSKFLEQSSQDLIRPVTVEHYKELLQGEAYFKDMYRDGWFVDVMTDNITAMDLQYPTTVVNAKLEFAKHAYQWSQDLEAPTGTFTDRLFQTLYKNILTANTCLESLDNAEGTVDAKQVLKGQALFTRAYGYFVLANLYAKAYNEAQPSDLCVPLILETTPSLKRYPRATVKEVWDLITQDVTAAVNCLEQDNNRRTYWEINYKAALLLASRVFLFTEEYDKVINYGEKFMLLNPTLKDITAITLSPSPGGTIAVKTFLYAPENPEVVFTFSKFGSAIAEGSYPYYTREIVGLSPMVFSASANVTSPLINSYGANDRRKNYWFSTPSGAPGVFFATPGYTPMKVNFYDGARTSQYMRSGEVYLNLAEAYVRKSTPDNNKAINLLNLLRSKRIASYTPVAGTDFISQQDLVSFVGQERRRELCFEEFHRWWDLRRSGQPALQHNWMDEVYELEEHDMAYVLSFPKSELEFNPALEPNPRPVRVAK